MKYWLCLIGLHRWNLVNHVIIDELNPERTYFEDHYCCDICDKKKVVVTRRR